MGMTAGAPDPPGQPLTASGKCNERSCSVLCVWGVRTTYGAVVVMSLVHGQQRSGHTGEDEEGGGQSSMKWSVSAVCALSAALCLNQARFCASSRHSENERTRAERSRQALRTSPSPSCQGQPAVLTRLLWIWSGGFGYQQGSGPIAMPTWRAIQQNRQTRPRSRIRTLFAALRPLTDLSAPTNKRSPLWLSIQQHNRACAQQQQ
jgi:hypothetical protein